MSMALKRSLSVEPARVVPRSSRPTTWDQPGFPTVVAEGAGVLSGVARAAARLAATAAARACSQMDADTEAQRHMR